jgi:hypothetical protein
MQLSRIPTIALAVVLCLSCVRSANKAQSSTELYSFDPKHTLANSPLLEQLFVNWREHSTDVNFHRTGLRPLFLLNSDKWWRPTYTSDPFFDNSVQFANYGHAGFLLAKTEKESHSTSNVSSQAVRLDALQLHWRGALLPPPEFRSGSQNRTAVEELKAEFSKESIAFLFESREDQRQLSCQPLGSHANEELYRIQNNNHATCILFRSHTDSRKKDTEIRSSLNCFDTEKKYFWDTKLDRTHLMFPISDNEIVVYESAYVPPRITHIDLATAQSREVPRKIQNIGVETTGLESPIPEMPLGAYGCKATTTRITKNDSSASESKAWYFVDAAIFKGTRVPDPLHDLVWEAHISPENEISVHRLSWGQAANFFPDLTVVPPAACALEPSIDVKCALSVLQLSVHVSLEMLANRIPSEKMRKEVSLLTFILLDKVAKSMGSWLLSAETQSFQELFSSELDSMSEDIVLPGKYFEAAEDFMNADRELFEKKETEARLALRSYLSAPDAYWKVLLGKHQD